jgi:hypothetical protein
MIQIVDLPSPAGRSPTLGVADHPQHALARVGVCDDFTSGKLVVGAFYNIATVPLPGWKGAHTRRGLRPDAARRFDIIAAKGQFAQSLFANLYFLT